MIYITGDFHSNIDGYRIKKEHFNYDGLTKMDYLLNCGDFGYVWSGNEKDNPELDALNELPVTILFVDGNHENFDALEQYPIEYWNGGRVQFIREHVIHLLRGEVYTIEGKKFFTFGGGTSIDKARRIEGISWWPQEIPSDKEFMHGLDVLNQNDWKVDYVITHTAPASIISKIAPYIGKDVLNDYLQVIQEQLSYEHWYFGHYHKDIDLDEKHSLLYYAFVPAGKNVQERDKSRRIIKDK